jgi:protoheme IX farnesyltransferase
VSERPSNPSRASTSGVLDEPIDVVNGSERDGENPPASYINVGIQQKGSHIPRWVTKFTFIGLIYTLIVIAWGGFVRATFSGDGCGRHWPFCDGQVIPLERDAKTLIEFSHRLSGALSGFIAIGLLFVAFRYFPRKSVARLCASIAFGFTIIEGAIGAKLVLQSLVASNPSVARAFWMMIHLTNTFILLASMFVLWWVSLGRPVPKIRKQGVVTFAITFAAVGMLLLGVTGALAALGDMLFPSKTLVDGLHADLDPTSHFLVRLRFMHPLIAMSVGVFTVFLASFLSKVRPSDMVKKYSSWVVSVFAFQMLFGLANLIMKAPVAMQIVHLLLADILWLLFVGLSVAALSQPIPATVESEELGPVVVPENAAAAHCEVSAPLWKVYIALTKPRVVSLLLFTTITAAFAGARGWPGGWVLFAVTIGGYFAAGAANAINMVYDRDIDVRMERTATRPTVTQRISTTHALLFALVLESISFALLTVVCNVLSAMLALGGLLFYVFVYTMALKRRTWQNIVIGGAAGAFPPLVGYAAVTNTLNPMAWTLFAIIFLWTPVHFWALALLIKDEYKAAGIPMLPVVHGDRATVLQIAMYSVLTAVVSLIPLALNQAGWLYLLTVIGLNGLLFVRTFELVKLPERTQARQLFKFSMVYLALLFLVIAIDRSQVF